MKSFTKRELIETLTRRSLLSKSQATDFLHHLLALVTETLQEGSQVRLLAFGTFSTRVRAARNGRHPKTGDRVLIKSLRVPVFKPGKWFRNSIR